MDFKRVTRILEFAGKGRTGSGELMDTNSIIILASAIIESESRVEAAKIQADAMRAAAHTIKDGFYQINS